MREALKTIARKTFLAADRLDVHVQPASYYSSTPSRKRLRRTEPHWRRPLSAMPFSWDLDAQQDWLSTHSGHVSELPLTELVRAEVVGGFRYGPIEAQLLYSVVRTTAPGRIVEIGSGSSTWVMSTAVQRNAGSGRSTEIDACDPYTAPQVAGLPHVRALQVSGATLGEEVRSLVAGDLLFIDSTHTVRTGSELAHLYLELIPVVAPGVLIHIHDIYLPYLFAPDLYDSLFDWQETTLVAALLTGNQRLAVRCCLSALHDARPAALTRAFPEYRRRALDRGLYAADDRDAHFPSSLWLEVVA